MVCVCVRERERADDKLCHVCVSVRERMTNCIEGGRERERERD